MHPARSLTTTLTMALALLAGVALPTRAGAGEIDLTRAVVVVPDGLSGPENKAVQLLVEEVRARSGITWDVSLRWPSGAVPVVAIGPARLLRDGYEPGADAHPAPARRPGMPARASGSAPWTIRGRGTPGGAGRRQRCPRRPLRRRPAAATLRMSPGKVALPDRLDLASAPQYPLRGHQLGYRPKTNSYDAWDLPQWERYIRDLAVFGTNAIELIPPRSDDDADSPHFPRPPLEMMAGMSGSAPTTAWTSGSGIPAMDADYADPKTVELALEGVGRGLPEAAPDRRGLRARRRPRPHPAQVPDGPPGEAGRQPPPLPPGRPDVGLAAELLPRSGSTSSSRLMKAEPAWLERRGLRPAGAREPARAAEGHPGEVSDPRLPRHHAQPALPVPGPRLGRRLCADRGPRGDQSPPAGRVHDLPRVRRPDRSASSRIPRAATTTSTRSSGARLGWDPEADRARRPARLRPMPGRPARRATPTASPRASSPWSRTGAGRC